MLDLRVVRQEGSTDPEAWRCPECGVATDFQIVEREYRTENGETFLFQGRKCLSCLTVEED